MNPDAGREMGRQIVAALGWVCHHPVLVVIVVGVLIFVPMLLHDWSRLRSTKREDETVRGGEVRSERELRHELKRRQR